MTLGFVQIARGIITVCGVALVWLAFFELNDWLFSQLAYTERAHWIFLPAAFRVLAVLLCGGRGAIGLMVGAYLTLPHQSPDDFVFEVSLSISSGLAPLAAVAICQRLFPINSDLAGLRGTHIVALSVANAFANSVLLNIVIASAGRHHGDGVLAATIFIGDMLGAAILLLAIALGVSAYTRSRSMRG